jgi:hypothetical protein
MRVEYTMMPLTAGPTPNSRRKFLYAPRSAFGSRHAANMMSALADLALHLTGDAHRMQDALFV